MSGRWFRFYDDSINNPKALKLSDKTYRVWVGILCVASKHDGCLPPFEDIAIYLRMKPEKLQPELEKLIAAELIDHDDNGLRPHDWNERQYKSDVSTERVKRFRNGKRNVSVTPPDTDTDTDTEKRESDRHEVSGISGWLSENASSIAASFLKSGKLEPDDPQVIGLTYQAQNWLNCGITQDFILAKGCQLIAAKAKFPHANYLDTSIRNAWAEEQSRPPTPEKSNVQTGGSVIAAADRLIKKLASFDDPAPRGDGELRSGTGASHVRLLS